MRRILARRNHEERHGLARAQEGIVPIDLVVCNLYPFRHVANRRGVTEPEVIANIDVGGPTMVRAAAKNFDSVAVVTDPERYGFLLDELRSGERRAVATRPAASWRPRRSRTRPATTRPSRSGSARPSRSPTGSCSTWSRPADLRLRREPAPARRLLRRGRRPPPPAVDDRAAGRRRRCRSTTSGICRRRAVDRRARSSCRPARSSSTQRPAAWRSVRRSRRHTSARWMPTRWPPSAA